MTIPTYDQFIEPILRFLAKNPEGAVAKSVHDAVADVLGLSADDRLQILASGAQLVYENRSGWAHDRLKRAGLSSAPKRGFWKLTPEGQLYVAKHQAPKLAAREMRELMVSFRSIS